MSDREENMSFAAGYMDEALRAARAEIARLTKIVAELEEPCVAKHKKDADRVHELEQQLGIQILDAFLELGYLLDAARIHDLEQQLKEFEVALFGKELPR